MVRGRRPRVVILGAGYGGLRVALRLSGRWGGRFEVLLIDRCDYHQLVTRLPEVAAGGISPLEAAVPLAVPLAGRPVRFLQTTVRALDLGRPAVLTDIGWLEGDWLVVALGSEPAWPAISGLAQVAFPFRTLSDAVALGERLARGPAPTVGGDRVVVVGGGFTGVELAAAVAEGYAGRWRVTLVEMAPRLLRGYPDEVARRATHILERLGAEVLTGAQAVAADARGVDLADGRRLPAGVVVWAGGITAPAVVRQAGPPLGPDGRVEVAADLALPDQPAVFVIGDCARVRDPVTGRVVAPSAQVAVQAAEAVVANIAADWRGGRRRSFRPRLIGAVLALGAHAGLALVDGCLIAGRAALALETAALAEYLRTVGGLRLVAGQWGLAVVRRLWSGWAGPWPTTQVVARRAASAVATDRGK